MDVIKHDGPVRLNLYMPTDSKESLERLQRLSGRKSMADTVRAALKLYHCVLQEGVGKGKDLYLIDPKTGEKTKLVDF